MRTVLHPNKPMHTHAHSRRHARRLQTHVNSLGSGRVSGRRPLRRAVMLPSLSISRSSSRKTSPLSFSSALHFLPAATFCSAETSQSEQTRTSRPLPKNQAIGFRSHSRSLGPLQPRTRKANICTKCRVKRLAIPLPAGRSCQASRRRCRRGTRCATGPRSS